MGLFSFVGKAVGAVAKGVASRLTGGASDMLLKVLKGRADAKKASQQTAQAQALYNKIGGPPAVPVLTRGPLAQPGEGWNFARRGTASPKRAATRGKRKPRTAPASEYYESPEDRARYDAEERRLTGGGRSGSPAKPRTAKKATGGAKRTVPKGGLDLAKIGQMYRAAGKPMPWAEFIKANSHIRVK